MSWLDKINWNKENLVPVIVQEIDTNQDLSNAKALPKRLSYVHLTLLSLIPWC